MIRPARSSSALFQSQLDARDDDDVVSDAFALESSPRDPPLIVESPVKELYPAREELILKKRPIRNSSAHADLSLSSAAGSTEVFPRDTPPLSAINSTAVNELYSAREELICEKRPNRHSSARKARHARAGLSLSSADAGSMEPSLPDSLPMDAAAVNELYQAREKWTSKKRPDWNSSARKASRFRASLSLRSAAGSKEATPRDPPPIFESPVKESYPVREESIWKIRPNQNSSARKAHRAHDVLTSLSAAGSCVVSTAVPDPSISSRFVSFAPRLVTAVQIPSHRSLTDEEKHRLYRGKDTVNAEMKMSARERNFEHSRFCHDHALEESLFFCNHLGELVHPAHFLRYVRRVLPTVSRDTIVPGYSSFDDYHDSVMQYGRSYNTVVRKLVRHQSNVESTQVVSSSVS